MYSPMSSPSVPIRAIAHTNTGAHHPHIPRTSYFSPVVQASSPSPPRYPSPTTRASYPAQGYPAPQSAYPAYPASPRRSSLSSAHVPSSPLGPSRADRTDREYVRPPQTPYAIHESQSTYEYGPYDSALVQRTPPPVRPPTTRRNSFRESAIPLRPAPPPAQPRSARSSKDLSSVAETGRRRPSFKIDLPPRPIPVELLHSVHTSAHTPYPPKEERRPSLAQKTADNTALNAHTPPVDYIDEYAPAPIGYGGFRDSFAQGGDEYIILQPSPDVEMDPYEVYKRGMKGDGYIRELAEPTADPWTGAGIVGLGYTLNKLRAPTPWVRGNGEDSEWLSQREVEEMEGRIGRMAVQ